ncbi:MAG: ATP-dependent DNA helicase RecG [Acidimicrobiia bacterium]|nr:ATP-dependent DNA helicase RecG [Acidimicrobiia bacterium]
MPSLVYLSNVPVEEVKGIGSRTGEALRSEGIGSVTDFLLHVPRRYIDRSNIVGVADVPVGEEVTVIGTVKNLSSIRPRKGLVIINATVEDETGSIGAVWFNQRFRLTQLNEGAEVALSGKVERFRGKRQMKSPEADVLSSSKEGLVTGRVVPIHRSVAKMKPGNIRRSMHNALGRSRPIDDPVPDPILNRAGLVSRDAAIQDVHFPDSMADAMRSRRRLAFDELFRLEVALAAKRHHQRQESTGIEHKVDGTLAERFIAGLPYELTGAQRRVLTDMIADLRSPVPTNRLLQGEVGSGKTVVAVATLLYAVEGGFQTAVMAPTEVLATQHFLGISRMIADSGLAPPEEGEGAGLGMGSLFDDGSEPGVKLALLTRSAALVNFAPGIDRATLLSRIAEGGVDIVIGTHALIQEGVDFASLGAAVIDEQHRFGVGQRVELKSKARGMDPDVLIMTATPIPRTLSMTLYGDLDVSVIDELPAGRSPIETTWLSRGEEDKAWDLVRSEVAAGRQAFVVCPLVEDSDKLEVTSATTEFERLKGVFPDLVLGLIHGQLHPEEKSRMMAGFNNGEIDVLVSTTVIEVGIDVPNATVMVIEDADRFGLSQLHQLRGRVGRGEYGGHCILVADPATEDGEQRLRAMVGSTDGFYLAEVDLGIRGQGTVFGSRQSGVGDLRVADVMRDIDLLEIARSEGFALVDDDPELARHTDLRDEIGVFLSRGTDENGDVDNPEEEEDLVEWLFRS